MRRFMVSYDLIRPEKDYAAVIASLRAMGATPVLRSQWIVKSAQSSYDLFMKLANAGGFDSNDRILITEIGGENTWSTTLNDKMQ